MSKAATWWATVLQNRLVGLVLAMVVIVPLVAVPVDTKMQGVAALVVEAFAIVLMATLLWHAKWNLKRDNVLRFFRTGVNTPVVLFMALVVVSCLMSPMKGVSTQETLRIGAGVLLYFVIAYHFRRSEYVSRLVDTLVYLAMGVSVIAFISYGATSEARASAPFGDAQLLGSFLMVMLPIVGAAAMSEGNQKRQLVARIAAVLAIACLLLTQTRSAWIGLAAGGVTFAVLGLLTLRKKSPSAGFRKHELVVPAMLLVIAAGFFMLVSPDRAAIINRIGTLGNTSQDASWKSRQSMYDGAMTMIREKPLTGHGIGVFPQIQAKYTGHGMRFMSCCSSATLGEQAHSLWLQIGAELGIPGLLLLGSIIVAFLVAGGRRVTMMDPGSRRMLLIGTLASTTAFAVDAATSPAWQFGQTTIFMWLLMGLGVSCMRPQPRTREQAAEVGISPRFTRPIVAFASLGLVVLLPMVGLAHGDPPSTGYCKTPKSIQIFPKQQVVNEGQSVCYTAIVTFVDNTVADVTCDADHTAFVKIGNTKITKSGCNKNCFTFYKNGPYKAGDIQVIFKCGSATATAMTSFRIN